MGRLAEGQRKLLEQLMGPEAMGILVIDLKLTDAKVCKNFTCGICPHDLFSNTRMDLGTCPHSHSTKLKTEYEGALKAAIDPKSTSEITYTLHDLLAIRNEYERNIVSFVDDCDRRIRAAQRRLEKTPEENNKTTSLMREIGEIQSAYDSTMAEVEALGSSGRVDESMAELAKAEALKAEKSDKERELQQLTDNSGASGHQKLRVCDICGAYLSILDSDRRLADHFGGKMHLGYLQLRTMIDDWRERGPNEQPGRASIVSSVNGSSSAAAKTEGGESKPVPMATEPEEGEVRANGADHSANGKPPVNASSATANGHRDTEMAPPPPPARSSSRERRSPEHGERESRDKDRRSDRDRSDRDRERSDRDRESRHRSDRSDRDRRDRSRERERDSRSSRDDERSSRSSRRREHEEDGQIAERDEKRRRYD